MTLLEQLENTLRLLQNIPPQQKQDTAWFLEFRRLREQYDQHKGKK